MARGAVRLKRVYDPPAPSDGRRILVDRLWPRGLSKDAARVDLWVKDVAPSDALRRWFGHDPERWDEFRRRYTRELDAAPDAVAALRRTMAGGHVTLVYGAKDEAHNNAAALAAYLARRRAASPREPR